MDEAAAPKLSRRSVLRAAGAAALGMPGIVRAEDSRPQILSGVQCGDVADGRATIWCRSDRPARMLVEYSTTESFQNVSRVIGPAALEVSDLTARVELRDLPAGERIFYRVRFQDLADLRATSEPVGGTFRTPANGKRAVKLAWSGDMIGQGWGHHPDRGGIPIFEAMRRAEPDVFVHSGDTIYADNPLQAEVRLEDGTLWRNTVIPEKSKVAETLDEFRGNHRYNLMDPNVRAFNASVAQLVQWDDHEVKNNWYPQQILDDPKYQVKSVALLAARAKRAFLDYAPLRPSSDDPERVYRAYPQGPSLEVFMLDERSYRAANGPNRQPEPGPDAEFLGPAQLRWLKARLLASTATWKVIASDMPLGLVVKDGPDRYEAWANGNGPALGRELEAADLLRFMKTNRIRNVVWITADVHYAAAHYYDPAKARFSEFDPFWEFVAGPLHAGTFGPGELDDTFGPQVRFTGIPRGLKANRPPSEGFQFFGLLRIDPQTEALTASLHSSQGTRLYQVELPPVR